MNSHTSFYMEKMESHRSLVICPKLHKQVQTPAFCHQGSGSFCHLPAPQSRGEELGREEASVSWRHKEGFLEEGAQAGP